MKSSAVSVSSRPGLACLESVAIFPSGCARAEEERSGRGRSRFEDGHGRRRRKAHPNANHEGIADHAFPSKTPTIFIISMPATAIGPESLQLPTSIANQTPHIASRSEGDATRLKPANH